MFAAAFVAAALTVASASPAPSAAPSAAAPGAAMPPSGTYTYSVQQAGNELGKSTVKIERSDFGITVHEDQALQGSYVYTIDQIFNPTTLAPRAFNGVYARGQSSSTVRVAVDSGGATVTIDGTSGAAQFTNPPGIKQLYLLEGTLMSGFVLLPASIHGYKPSQIGIVEPRSLLQVVGTIDPHPIVARPSGIAPTDVVLSVTGKIAFDIWYDPGSFIVDAVSMPSQQVLITRSK